MMHGNSHIGKNVLVHLCNWSIMGKNVLLLFQLSFFSLSNTMIESNP